MAATFDNDDETQLPTLTAARPQPARRKMSMALINFWLDAGLLVAISFLGWVTAMLQIVFPAPTAAVGWTLWGLSYNQWHDAQFISLCAFALLVLVHLMLHWNWVCSVIATHVLRIKDHRCDSHRPPPVNQPLVVVSVLKNSRSASATFV
jgi:hypothetical protein